jgi:enamine deaminase RidA (YjgF/YER057c/UK114 family)
VSTNADSRVQQLNLILPPAPKPIAKYKPAVLVANILYVSGHGPLHADGKTMAIGRVGSEVDLEFGKQAARLVGLAILSTVRNTLKSLDKVKRLIKTLGMVNAAPDFKDHPKVIDGFSELMAEVFGDDAGVGARSAVGMGSLPGNISVEIECIFEISQ